MVKLERSQLEAWLIPGAKSLTMGDVVRIAGPDARVDAIEFATLAFTVAILRDVFPDDESVFRWVAARKPTIARGDLSSLEDAAIRLWNDPLVTHTPKRRSDDESRTAHASTDGRRDRTRPGVLGAS